MKTAGIIIAICLLALVGLGGYYVGNEAGKQVGAQQAKEAAQEELDNMRNVSKRNTDDYKSLSDDYSNLLSQYNNLYDAAQQYVSATRYAAPSPFTCTSSQLGFSTTTRCY